MTNFCATSLRRGSYKTPRSPTPTCPGPSNPAPVPASPLAASEQDPPRSDRSSLFRNCF